MLKDDTDFFLSQLLQTIKNDVLPKTRVGVKKGNKVFGAAILNKFTLDTIIAETNNELESPLFHGEITCLNSYFAHNIKRETKDLIFLSTHEPCSMCLSAIAWAGFREIYYFFSHQDSRDDFQIPHDLKILKELFNLEPGGYNKNNAFLSCNSIIEKISEIAPENRGLLMNEVTEIRNEYEYLSSVYQNDKEKNFIPLK